MKINFVQKTSTGKVRDENQDDMGFIDIPYGKIFVVADGMGGGINGKEAANKAVYTVLNKFSNDNNSITYELDKSIQEANRKIYEISNKNRQTGSTAAILVIKKRKAYIAHVGDSRIYLFRDSKLNKLTTDHSKVQSLLDAGVITIDEAKNHPDAHIITQCLGVNHEVNAEIGNKPLKIKNKDIFLLCSDGLWNMVDDQKITEILSGTYSVDVMCDYLINEALNAGGFDNITIQIVSVDIENEKFYTSLLSNIKSGLNKAKSAFIYKKKFLLTGIFAALICLIATFFSYYHNPYEIDYSNSYSYTINECNNMVTDIVKQVGYPINKEIIELTSISVHKEDIIGKAIEKKLNKKYQGLIDVDKEYKNYIEKVGSSMLPYMKREEIKYHFHVIQKDDEINAFAIPGGGIYIFSGLLKTLENEAQLAAIIGHEMMHVDLKHCTAIYQILLQIPKENQSHFMFILASIADQPFSSEIEAEADRCSLDLIYKLKYSPYQIVNYWETTANDDIPSTYSLCSQSIITTIFDELDNLLASHPTYPKRICLLKNHIIKLQEKNPQDSFFIGKWNYENKIPLYKR